MPTNLPPEYYGIEEQYRAATTNTEKLRYLDEMYGCIPKHKGTDKLRADLRKKMSKLKESVEQSIRSGGSRQTSPYQIDPEGAAQIAVIGPPNVGKSSLVKALTNANPEIGDYAFTTQRPIPGMMLIDNVPVQLIDTPPISPEFDDPQLYDLIRRADMILLVVDLQATPMDQIDTSINLLTKRHIIPDHLEEAFAHVNRRKFIKPLLVVANKTDDETMDEDYEVLCELMGGSCPHLIPLSADNMRHIDAFKQKVFEELKIIRVYSKAPGQEPNFSAPFVLPCGATVEDFAGKVHKDFVEGLRSARVWGEGVFDGQKVGRDHVLHDGDVVALKA